MLIKNNAFENFKGFIFNQQTKPSISSGNTLKPINKIPAYLIFNIFVAENTIDNNFQFTSVLLQSYSYSD